MRDGGMFKVMANGDGNQKPCTNCGHCPTCGNSSAPAWPWGFSSWPYRPWWFAPYPTTPNWTVVPATTTFTNVPSSTTFTLNNESGK